MPDKKYIIDNAELMAEWDWEKNNKIGLDPLKITVGSHSKAWWICKCRHEWEAEIKNRAKGRTGCPYCLNKKVLIGFNDLATTNPELAIEWNYEKNKDLSPKMVVPGSLKKVWWKCSHGHEWQETVVNRTARGYNCPFCSSHKVLVGFNDLATKHPDVAKEWHPTKNGSLTPCEVSASSKKKAWWICSKGHEWQAVIGSRTDLRAGCPICNQEMKTSFPEQAILFYLRKITCAESRNNDFGKEIDVYLPEYKIGIEHNGKFYHKDKKEADKQKILFFVERNIRIITVAEGYRNTVHNDIIEYEASTNKESLNWAIRELLKKIGLTEMHIDVENDASEIYSQYIIAEKENSLAVKLPEIAQEWNYEKNGLLTPEMISNASGKKVWWKCSKGHEWQATVNTRKKGYSCPYCSNNDVLEGFNDLATLYPMIASEWNYEKNENLLPTMVLPGSGKKVWWKCKNGHEWQARILNRKHGNGCPYCSGRHPIKGYNDLQTINPNLANEWNHKKNNGLTPTDVKSSSQKKVWWKCSNGHEWQATIQGRNKGAGCPYCSGRYAINGLNDLQTVNPVLAKEWNYEKNNGLTPANVLPNSNKIVWWKCNKGHEWQMKIQTRNNGTGCPICKKIKKQDK